MNGINPTIKSVSKTPTLNTALQLGQQAAIAASASVLGVNRGILDLAATGANQLAEKLSYGTPGFSIASLDQLLKAQGHQAGGKKAETQTVAQNDTPYRGSVGDLTHEQILAIENDARALTSEEIKAAKTKIEEQIKAGTIVSTGGELFQSSTVKLYDTKKLEMNLKNNSPFKKLPDGSFTLQQGTQSFKFTADQFQKLLNGEEVAIGTGTDAQKFKYDSSKNELKMGDAVISNHGLADISYGKSQLSGDGHETAGTMLGFLNLNADAKTRAESIDTLLNQVQGALPPDSPLKNDAHTLSLLAGTFGKREKDGNITVDANSLGALTDPLKKQLDADQALRNDVTLSDLKTPHDIHTKALEVNNRSYLESASRFDFNKTDLDNQLNKLGFDPKELSQFAGSAYAAGAELSRRLETPDSEGKSQLANEILQVAQEASTENPLKLNLSIIATAKTNTDATRAYDDSVRGADGAFGTLLSLSGLSKDRVNDLQLVASGEDGLKKAQEQLVTLLNTPEIQQKIQNGSIQITGLDTSIYGHANEAGMLLDKTAKGDHQTLDAADANDISKNIAEIANAGNIETVRMTVVGCHAGALSEQLAKEVHTQTQGEAKKANSEVIVVSTKGYAKTSGSSLKTDDVTRQFTFGADGTLSGHETWSNEGGSYNNEASTTDRIILPSSKQDERVTQARKNGVETEFTGYRSHTGNSAQDKQTNQSAGSAGGAGPAFDPKKPRDGAGCLEPQDSPANDEWKKQTAAVS